MLSARLVRSVLPAARSLSCARAFSTVYYTESHEWLKQDAQGHVTVGITAFAADKLGDVVYVTTADAGDHCPQGEFIGAVESVKAASDVYAPVAGTIVEGNQAIIDNPGLVNEDPMGEGWFVKLQPDAEVNTGNMMTEEQYEKFIE